MDVNPSLISVHLDVPQNKDWIVAAPLVSHGRSTRVHDSDQTDGAPLSRADVVTFHESCQLFSLISVVLS